MTEITFDSINVGDEIPTFVSEPISRGTLALYAGASGDHHPIHIDLDVAKGFGFDDVFAHGMLSMAYLGNMLINWVPQSQLRSFNNRFGSITHLKDQITCSGKVVEKFEENGEKMVRLDVAATNQEGDVKLAGQATVAFV
jgi:acyl dehydratase